MADPTTSIRQALLSAAKGLCSDFASAAPTSTLLSHFCSSKFGDNYPRAFEHGHPCLAPFLGRHFFGEVRVREYFDLLQRYLLFSEMSFRDYVVDEVEKVVCVRGQARFVWKETGKGWYEEFIYRLLFAQEGGGWKVSQYEVWADSGSL